MDYVRVRHEHLRRKRRRNRAVSTVETNGERSIKCAIAFAVSINIVLLGLLFWISANLRERISAPPTPQEEEKLRYDVNPDTMEPAFLRDDDLINRMTGPIEEDNVLSNVIDDTTIENGYVPVAVIWNSPVVDLDTGRIGEPRATIELQKLNFSLYHRDPSAYPMLRQLAHASDPRKIRVSLATLEGHVRRHENGDAIAKVSGFIFHMARCGSTALANVLAVDDENIVYVCLTRALFVAIARRSISRSLTTARACFAPSS